MYRFREGARVADAVSRAGGLKPKALLTQTTSPNAADGEQVVVPLPGVQAAAAGSGAAPDDGPVI